jgi:hypothetical protein
LVTLTGGISATCAVKPTFFSINWFGTDITVEDTVNISYKDAIGNSYANLSDAVVATTYTFTDSTGGKYSAEAGGVTVYRRYRVELLKDGVTTVSTVECTAFSESDLTVCVNPVRI